MAKSKTASARRTADALSVHEWRKGEQLDVVIAIDPGAVNCGMAYFSIDPANGQWSCEDAWKFGPYACLDWTEQHSTDIPVALKVGFVIESFRLYPGMAAEQGFSAMGTPQVIGALLWILAKENRRREDLGRELIPVAMQQASTRFHGCEQLGGACARVPKKGISHDVSVHTGPNVHARDAEAHGIFFITRKLGGRLNYGIDSGQLL